MYSGALPGRCSTVVAKSCNYKHLNVYFGHTNQNMQADGIPEFMPRFLQQGEWGKAFSQARSSSGGDINNPGNTSSKKQAYSSSSGSLTKTSSRKTGESHGGEVKGIKKPSEAGSSTVYSGGCASRPNTPQNAVLHCSIFSGCRASCMANYIFPNGEKQLFITCQEGEWQVENVEWEVIPHCEPVCLPPCQHNGICVKPNECNCPENYAGAQCQYEKKPCLNYPTLPANSRRSCNSKTCTIMCADGHKFPDGSAIANMICRDGTWIPSQPEWKSIPDCEPVCKPPCENGGNCLSFNVCQCPQEFRGPQCQYATSVCSVEKLGFNGNYKCKGSDTSVTCNISCPSGSHFQEQPASEYVCFYSAGTFLPTPVPQCIFEAGIEMLPGNGLPGKFQYGSLNSINYQNWSNTSSWSQLLGGVLPFDIATSGRTAVSVIEQLPHPGFCYVWGQSHYKTFDGKVFSFESQCSYTVLLDKVDNTFNINLEPKATHTVIRIFAQDKEYILTLSGKYQ
ncbi:delta and Notch-like epidermal growth factor-related receptor isoform X2 [Zootermopsis nevadensis]|uniref:delta and Notch-like epidermal growth factor-related receptor isoform X2 n=1 Tax=Zootermopsis nevadensis TaxID=136037 RepID=UPI000B8E4554|nr:delta and Notch-like epidermal growth factor-related receptor isoform X2 [Zootermopsis nevadensis]